MGEKAGERTKRGRFCEGKAGGGRKQEKRRELCRRMTPAAAGGLRGQPRIFPGAIASPTAAVRKGGGESGDALP
eukprot:89713-Chlamydomonas_euryale.AAC.1